MSAASGEYVFDRAGIREVDRLAIETYGIPGIVLMENAARGASEVALRMLRTGGPASGTPALRAGRHPARSAGVPESVIIVCGSGNNGGDGYAMARHLHNAGIAITLLPLGAPRPGGDAAVNRSICQRMNLCEIGAAELESLEGVDLIVDAIFGTGLDRAVSGEAAAMIRWINVQAAPVLAVDLPSGMDADTGQPLGEAVRAAATVTFAGLKAGFQSAEAAALLGAVHVADIGVPRELLHRLARV